MVGSGAAERSKEAVGMIALHVALRSVCLNSDWNYSVFWTIRPRPRMRGGNGCKFADDNGSLMLMWEDGFCKGRVGECLEEMDPVRKAFSKMSIQLYNYGEGLIGKVASDKCHKWVFKEQRECEQNTSNYWQSSVDALPLEWTYQFESGIQTIAVIQAGHGLLQLGSCKMIPEDLHFVLRMRHIFESLCYQSGFHLPHLFSSTRDVSPSSAVPVNKPATPLRPLPPLFNWGPTPMRSVSYMSNVHTPASFGLPPSKDKARMFMLPHAPQSWMEGASGHDENDIKWPNGLTLVNALTGRSNEARLLFQPDSDRSSLHDSGGGNASNGFLSVDCSTARMEEKFLSSFTLPARMATSSSLASLDHVADQDPLEYGIGAGMFSDDMRSFLG
ncbi:UNVERIFIED_CONTAM: protein RICE SALT SENSITIVE 3 [Sesamum latifolium]|uniref:Protein RICE SALT SENSITIVE 3 n=1 Tax=Sesamum latifolium TaxID=2727402 RepID=A0AAW2WUB3_9LAMI